MAIAQAGRGISVATPLGKDILILESFSGTEAISTLFAFELLMLSEDPSIPFDALVGQKVTVTVALENGGERHFDGYVRSFARITSMDDRARYRAEMVPWFWFLTQNTNSRVFQNKTTPEIIKRVVQDRGFAGDMEDRLQATYEARDYCVQYQETDFNFVSRLMEEDGIFYFFQHQNGDHKLILGDAVGVHAPCPQQARARFHRGRAVFEEDTVFTFRKEQHYHAGRYTLADYHFLMPSKGIRSSTTSVVQLRDNSKFEVYDYPGYYARPRFDEGRTEKVQREGDRLVKLRMEREEVEHIRVYGTSTCRAFSAGYKFTLTDHPGSDLNDTYLLTSVTHEASSNVPDDTVAGYSNSFAAIPATMPYRPTQTTVKPTVPHLQTAVVVGKQGEEIWTDKYGRVKVQFHWDREGKMDENSSCWVRVAQNWAGKRWGTTFLPWIGQEVIVDFLEGDPDQPIIIGSVYNAEQMPPYELPENKTQSGIKTRSSKGGDSTNFNEIRFEDKKGEEQILIHAEKNQDIEVENDETTHVKHDRTVIVETGNDLHQIKQGNREVQIDMGNDTLTIKMGNQVTTLNLGKSETEAMQSIELKVGQSSIKLDQTGVTIKGMVITVDGQIQTQVKGLITQVNADAMLQIKGGITMIN
jgi:type VI secretion system secreted protein VgrG